MSTYHLQTSLSSIPFMYFYSKMPPKHNYSLVTAYLKISRNLRSKKLGKELSSNFQSIISTDNNAIDILKLNDNLLGDEYWSSW